MKNSSQKKPIRIHSLIFIYILFCFFSPAEALTLKGRILERGTQVPMKEISFFYLPSKNEITTDKNGFFEINENQVGTYQFILNVPDYKKNEFNFEITNDTLQKSQLELKPIYLERTNDFAFETRIYTQRKKKDITQKSLSQNEFLTLPGAQGDPVKAVQNLPGVNRSSGFSSQVTIQGSAPKDTVYNIDGHEIPLVFHFGGLSSVVMPEALDRVDYLSAGYEADHSRALGGIISLQTKTPDPGDRDSKSFFFIDTLKAGGLYEKKIDDESSYLISARHSYVGLILGKVAEKQGDFDLTVVPEFTDFTAIYHRKISPKENFKWVTVASRDSLGFLLKEPLKTDPAFRGNFVNETLFYRLIPQWSKELTTDSKINLSLAIGQDQIKVDAGEQFFKLKSNVVSTRGSWEKTWWSEDSSSYKTQWGFDNYYTQARATVKLPVTRDEGGVRDPFSSGETRETDVTGKSKNLGIFFKNDFTFQKTSYLPSLRLDSWSDTQEKMISPRFAIKHKYSEDLELKLASGLYYQPPEPVETDETFGNPEIKSPKSIHLTMGFEKDFRENTKSGFVLSLSLFDKWMNNLVIRSSQFTQRNGNQTPENYNNEGHGRAYGIETQIKFTDIYPDFPITGWISYTLSRSLRWSPAFGKTNAESDQIHNLNLILSHEFENQWKVSSRYRYVTGNPITPIIGGTLDADNDVYVPTRGALYSDRLRDFQQLDLRFDRKYTFDTSVWTLYIDIQNILNQKNPESYEYSYNYLQKSEVSGLPFLPSIGLKGEF